MIKISRCDADGNDSFPSVRRPPIIPDPFGRDVIFARRRAPRAGIPQEVRHGKIESPRDVWVSREGFRRVVNRHAALLPIKQETCYYSL